MIKRLFLRDYIFFFCFFFFLTMQLFNGVYKYLVPFPVQFALEFISFSAIFCSQVVWRIKIPRKYIFIYLFAECITGIMLIVYFSNHHYLYTKILSNCITAHFYLFEYAVYLLIIPRYFFTSYFKRIIIATIFLELTAHSNSFGRSFIVLGATTVIFGISDKYDKSNIP